PPTWIQGTSTTAPVFSCTSHAHHRDLHSFPTRRSSDLRRVVERVGDHMHLRALQVVDELVRVSVVVRVHCGGVTGRHSTAHAQRSEEHTSELQSRFDLVCRLLLEKKKMYSARLAGKLMS